MANPDLRSMLLGGESGERALFKSAAVLAEHIRDGEYGFTSVSTIATLLSTLFTGKRACSDELRRGLISEAKKRATKLSWTSTEKEELVAGIHQAIDQLNTDHKLRVEQISIDNVAGALNVPQAIPELWKDAAQHTGLICVEYRDFPQSSPGGRYQEMAESVGKFIAEGARFAMFQPYGLIKERLGVHAPRLPSSFLFYLEELNDLLEKTYFKILEEVLDAAKDLDLDSDPEEVASRIMLYRRILPENNPDACLLAASGMQSRLFYVDISKGKENKAEQKVFQWVSTSGREDFFIQRSEQSLPTHLIRDYFSPITSYWSDNQGKLLTTNEQIALASEMYCAGKPDVRWEIAITPAKGIEAVNKAKASREVLDRK